MLGPKRAAAELGNDATVEAIVPDVVSAMTCPPRQLSVGAGMPLTPRTFAATAASLEQRRVGQVSG
jgi:hypothetical protein